MTVLLVAIGATVAVTTVAASSGTGCSSSLSWVEGCDLTLEGAIGKAERWGTDFVLPTGSSQVGPPGSYSAATVDAAGVTICVGPEPADDTNRGPVYLTNETGRCEPRRDAVVVDGGDGPALAIEAPGVTVEQLTLRARASSGDVAAVDVNASDVTIRDAEVEIAGGVGVRFAPGAVDGTVRGSTVVASPVDGSSASVGALDGVRAEAEGTRVALSTIRGFAGAGVDATAADAEVVGTVLQANQRGVRLGPGADGAVVELSRFEGDGVGVALTGNATDGGPGAVAVVDSDLRRLAGVALELGDGTERLFVDARGNDWGAYECSAVPTRVRDRGDANLVGYLPFDTPLGLESCPSGTADVHARFGFDPALTGEDGDRLAFDDGTVDVTVELFDARGEPKAFPGTPDGQGPRIVVEPVADLDGCSQTDAARAFPPVAPPSDHVATFALPAADLICPGEPSTVWKMKLASPVDHPVSGAADRIASSYHNADARDLFGLAPPLADLLDRTGTNLDATADPVEMRLVSPTGPVTRTADQPLDAEVELLDAAGRVATHDDTRVALVDGNGTEWMSATADGGVVSLDQPGHGITEVGVYDALDLTADGLEDERFPPVTVEPGALDHVTFTSDPDETTAGQTVTFHAEARDRHDNVRDDAVTYSTDGPGSIDADTGEFVSTETGTATIEASAGTGADRVTDTTTIDVTPGTLDHIELVQAPSEVDATSAATFEAIPHDAHHNDRNDTVTYAVDSGPEGIDAQTGEYDPSSTGVATINASAGGEWVTTRIQIAPGPLDHVAFVEAPDGTDAVTPVNLTAEPRDAEGNARDDEVTYELASGSGAVDPATGVFVPEETGTTRIRASVGDRDATATIRVDPGPVHDVVFTRAPTRTDADTSVGFVAAPVDAKGNGRNDPVAYHISQGAGTITDDGTYHPTEAGDTVVVASVGGASTATTIAVEAGALDHVAFTEAPDRVAVGLDATLRAEPRDAHGNARDDAVSYRVLRGPGAIDADGAFLADRPGEATVRAAAGDVAQTTTIEVTPGEVAEIAVRPDRVRRVAGETTPIGFTVVAHDERGNPVEIDPADAVEWSVDDPAAGSFDGAVFDPSDRAGTATVEATLAADPSIGSTATVAVEPGPVDAIDVTPGSLRLQPGATADLSATLLDAHGNERDGVVAWALPADVGTVDEAGRVVARQPGEADLLARHPSTGTVARVPVLVADDSPPIDRIVVEPGTLEIRSGGQRTLDVATVDADGFVTPDVDARFRTADATVAFVDADGTVHGRTVGSTRITARHDGHEAVANVTVVPGRLARLDVAPAGATLTPGDRLALSANATDLRFNPVTVDGVDWSLEGDEIGELTANGTLVATAEGDARVVATAGDVTASVPVTVTTLTATPDRPARLTVEPVPTRVGNVTATTYSAGVADARAGSTLTVETAGGDLERASVDVARDADRLSVLVTTQPGAVPSAPREVDLVDLTRVAVNRTDPAMFVDVGATREGVDLDSGQLNEIVGGMELTLRVPTDYFDQRDLDPSDVTLREYSDGRTVGEVPARLVGDGPVDGAYRYAADLDSFSAFAVLGGPGHAGATTDWSMILVVGFVGLFAAVAIAAWAEWE